MHFLSQGKIPCFCSACTSDCSDENVVKIVKIKFGYVSVVTKLKTVDCVRHILVCEPNYLVAFGKSGRLHIWVMNSTWRLVLLLLLNRLLEVMNLVV